MTTRRNIVVIGGGYIGTRSVEYIAQRVFETHRVVLIEKNSHFQHLFAFPRHAVVPGLEHTAFIPFTTMYSHCPPDSTFLVRAKVMEIQKDKVILDHGEPISYEYLVIATGTRLAPPGSLETETKIAGIKYFQSHQSEIARAQKVVIIGGGALGVQLATDTKDRFPDKSVTLVHSRDRVMNTFHPQLHNIVMHRTKELGIHVILGTRIKVPEGGFPNDASEFDVELPSGERLRSDLVVLATGQTPLSEILRSLSPSSVDPSGFISVKRSLQISDERFPNIFAVGDVAHTTNHKTARAGLAHAQVVGHNIARLINGDDEELRSYEDTVKGIQMSLGLKRKIIFRNPATPGDEPSVTESDNGTIDVGSRSMWERKAPGLTDYFL